MSEQFNGRNSILASDGCSSDSALSAVHDTSDDLGLFLFEDLDSEFGAGASVDSGMGDLPLQDALVRPSDSGQASPILQGAHVPFTVNYARKKAPKELSKIGLDDFEAGPTRWSAATIKSAVKHFAETIHDFSENEGVANWLFGQQSDPASFENCCALHFARPEILRLRIQFELWRKAKASFPVLTLRDWELPDFVTGKAFRTAGFPGIAASSVIWKYPGVPDSTLKICLSTQEYQARTKLAESHLISSHLLRGSLCWWLTGINPIVEAQERANPGVAHAYRLDTRRRTDISWSSSFP